MCIGTDGVVVADGWRAGAPPAHRAAAESTGEGISHSVGGEILAHSIHCVCVCSTSTDTEEVAAHFSGQHVLRTCGEGVGVVAVLNASETSGGKTSTCDSLASIGFNTSEAAVAHSLNDGEYAAVETTARKEG